ncbi:hypothetical protein BHE74_00046930 [Ensete ventricosum]|nr:hypothetical protein BHE74_00046930 [Ensete ventricosum]
MHISPSLFHDNVEPTTMSLPSTSPAYGSVAAASAVVGVDFCTAFPLHMVDKFIYFLSSSAGKPASIPTTISDVPSYHCHRSYLSAPVASRRYRTCSCRQPLLFIPFALSLRSLSPPAI